MTETGEELASASLVELAVSRLSREILSGNSDPGDRLVEEQLTKRFGISRAPVREALRLLAEQGLVEHVPRRGARVATLSDRDVQELYAVRDVLERHAVTAALADPATLDLTGVKAAFEALRGAVERGDRADINDAHRSFHLSIVRIAGNRQLTKVYESVILKIQLYMALNLRREAESERPAVGVHRHERMLEALESGDPEKVLAELTAHEGDRFLRESK
ncbi:GntR family transcriptional regulator [Virgisporangium aliadipatigenens]|uniref:GntR family transcriptional regulator n=1 Tax=Virgisporangium aliadipatigenens TaxID=741659 RepID=A0A8J3YU00_9ACTN|nr:GntR family transcriptional regulator [Virgisporangium aliadipatigenens]GIJ50433.1 GntR family transcriptional regulator [Virgisporangium aliadipatigenens]